MADRERQLTNAEIEAAVRGLTTLPDELDGRPELRVAGVHDDYCRHLVNAVTRALGQETVETRGTIDGAKEGADGGDHRRQGHPYR